MSLATSCRPKRFNQVVGQESIIKILQRQLDTRTFNNCYLFSGPTGVGKTTIARIFANEINQGQGIPIEVDAASNNGVDNVRELITHANERSINSEYKVIIVDECHMITTAGWNAFLKCLEEPPKYTIFIFCTTDAQKIPATIANRLMRFNFRRLNYNELINYLNVICTDMNVEPGVLEYITKISDGSVRSALANLEKVVSYGELTIDNTLTVLDGYSYDILFSLINAITDSDKAAILSNINTFYNSGKDLKLLIEQLIDVSMDLASYCIFKAMSVTSIPLTLEEEVKYTAGVFETQEQNIKYFNKLADKLLDIKFNTKYDTNLKTTLEVLLVNIDVHGSI